MTDLLSKPTPAAGQDDTTPPVEVVWIPAQKKKKRYLGLWLGIPAALIAGAAALCSFILIAPGVVVAGVDVGLRTPGVASQMVADALAGTRVTFETPTRDITLTGEELGLSIDSKAIAQLAHGEFPLWKVGEWNPGDVPITIDVDEATTLAALTAAAPETFPKPIDAKVSFDSKLKTFTSVNSQAGLGVDVNALATAVSNSLTAGSGAVTINSAPVAVQAPVSSAEARKEATSLNTLIAAAGFYIDGEKVFDVDPAVAASWIKVNSVDGVLDVTVNTDKALADMRPIVKTVPAKVDRPAVNKIIVTNSAGDHLRTVQEGSDGWVVKSTAGIAAGFVDSFAAGDGKYDLEITQTTFETQLAYRAIEVDKSEGLTMLYENGQLVDTYYIAVGRPETATDTGRFTVYAQLEMQDMGCSAGFDYCTKDVPWITYFNGDEGFHGTYWHSNFGPGAMMSHGCVNMTIEAAERVYRFAQEGTEVWVHE